MKKIPYAQRTRFAGDIVCEFVAPRRPSNRVIILASGCPGYPGRREDVLAFLARKGYWAFLPRYRGSWESDGAFLERSPHEDLLDVMSGIEGGFVAIGTNEHHQIPNPQFFLIGASFGGPAVLLAARDARVKKAVSIAGVVDWTKQTETVEPLELMAQFVPAAFGQAYRGDPEVWKKLAAGDFYSPVSEQGSIPGNNLLLIHAQDDMVVPYAPTQTFANMIGARLVSFRTGGHTGIGALATRRFWNHIGPFLARS